MRNASLDAGAADRAGRSSAVLTLVPAPAAQRSDTLTLSLLGARRMLAQLICAGSPK